MRPPQQRQRERADRHASERHHARPEVLQADLDEQERRAPHRRDRGKEPPLPQPERLPLGPLGGLDQRPSAPHVGLLPPPLAAPRQPPARPNLPGPVSLPNAPASLI